MAFATDWTINELVKMFNARRKNQFDCNVLVTGTTGKGKSSLILKMLLRFEGFRQWTHQIYSREDTLNLLKNQKFSYCWNDELIGVGYKREHWNNLQIELIKTLTQYRCNWNIFVGALPVFFTLDKELLKQFAINIDVIRRGEAIVHMRRDGRRYSDDPWDTKANAKLEEQWSKKMQTNTNFKIPYHKYSTYIGHLYWTDITEKQRKKYEAIRDKKKAMIEQDKVDEEEKSRPFNERLLEMMLKKEMDYKTFENICILNNKKVINVRVAINKLLKEKGKSERVKELLAVNPFLRNNPNAELLEQLKDF